MTVATGMFRQIGQATFDHLDMALLYEPGKKVANIQYVYYRSVQRNPTVFLDKLFYKETNNWEKFFSIYYTKLFRKSFE